MVKYFKNNNDYFKFINKHRDKDIVSISLSFIKEKIKLVYDFKELWYN